MTTDQLRVGTKLRECASGVVFLVAEQQAGSTVLVADEVVMLGCFDAPEVRHEDWQRRLTGWNNYRRSNVHQWLNADGYGWYVPAHEFDEPPTEEVLAARETVYDPVGHNAYAHKCGFLGWFGRTFREAVLPTEVSVTSDDGQRIETLTARAWLPSAAELGLRTHDPLSEGHALPLFRDFRMRYASPSRACLLDSQWQPAHFGPKNVVWYWLRTPNAGNPGFVYYKHYTNPYSYKFAASPWMGIRPVLRVAPLQAEQSNADGMWIIV